MRAKWMGVAVAAAVMVCGVQSAEAFTVSTYGDTMQDGYFTLSLSFTGTANRAEFFLYDVEQDSRQIGYTYKTISDSLAYLTSETNDNPSFGVKGITFNVFDPYYSGIVTGSDIPSYKYKGYSYQFQLILLQDMRYEFIIPNFNYPDAGNVTVSGDPFVSTVPLPSSAPLLGAALLALGGIGYASRRGREATAR